MNNIKIQFNKFNIILKFLNTSVMHSCNSNNIDT